MGGPVAWSARSPDLTPLDFFLWGCMTDKVCETETASREELVAKINTTAMEIRQRGLGNTQREIRRRAETCARGELFEHCPSQPLEQVRPIRNGDTEQLTQHKQLTSELSDKMAVESSEDRYVICSRNSETGTNSEKVY